MREIDDLIEWNHRNSAKFAHPGLSAEPVRRIAILTCMDARILPQDLLGIDVGEVHLMRNAGGIVTDDVIRSLAASQQMLGTEKVMIIQHTRCGLSGLDDDEVHRQLTERFGVEPPFRMGGFGDVAESVRVSIRALRESPYVNGLVTGFVYDVDSGRLEQVQDRSDR